MPKSKRQTYVSHIGKTREKNKRCYKNSTKKWLLKSTTNKRLTKYEEQVKTEHKVKGFFFFAQKYQNLPPWKPLNSSWQQKRQNCSPENVETTFTIQARTIEAIATKS